jgi:hypothetical protein
METMVRLSSTNHWKVVPDAFFQKAIFSFASPFYSNIELFGKREAIRLYV